MVRTKTDEPGGAKKTAAKGAARKATSSAGAPAPADPPQVKDAALSPRARAVKAAATSGAKKSASKKSGAKSDSKAASKGARGGLGVAPGAAEKAAADLRADLRAFASGRPEGWNHHDWLSFLDHLRERGHETSDADAIGLALERERLAVLLERVPGMGPRRVQALVERYDTIWSLSRADVDELASVPGMNRALAEKLRQPLH